MHIKSAGPDPTGTRSGGALSGAETHGPDRDTASLDETVEALLGASRALVAVSARSIATAPDVTLPQFRMLVVLSQGSCNLSSLAHSLDVAPSTALRMVDRLVDAGHVRRTIRADNRRETNLALTTSGSAVVDAVSERRRRDLRTVVEQVPADQRDELTRAMAIFASAADVLWPITVSSSDRLA